MIYNEIMNNPNSSAYEEIIRKFELETRSHFAFEHQLQYKLDKANEKIDEYEKINTNLEGKLKV